MRTVKGFSQTESGTALIEFALVTPILILLLVACLDFARALNAYVTVANAASTLAYALSLVRGVM